MDFDKMTDDELERMIAEKYGEDWTPADVSSDDELVKAFFKRVEEAAD